MLRAFAILTLCALPALAQDPNTAKRLSAEAETALAAQDWKTAVERAKAAIAADIDCLPAYITLGHAWEGLGEWYEAALAYDSGYGAYLTKGTDEDMRRHIDLRRRATERCGPLILAAGERALGDKDFANAESAAQMAIALPDMEIQGKVLLGRVHHAAGQFEQAVEVLADVIRSAQDRLELKISTQAEADALKAAVQPLLDAARREGVAALLASARAAFERKDYAATVDACDRVHALDDDEPESWVLAGRAHLAAQEWAEAVDALRSAR
jgi:tetratricopeptide (TPR) repeat protein